LNQEVQHFRRVYIVVDALDELDEDQHTREDFLDTVQALHLNVQLLATSRDIPSIEEMIEDPLRIQIRARQEDVEKYVTSRIMLDRYLKKHCQSDATLEDKIKRALRGSSRGM
jgi:chromosomal replication initiation ATPase DnaA